MKLRKKEICMLRKVLLSAAVASALASGAATAKVTISDAADVTVSAQGAASVAAMTPPAVSITLGAEYKVDDLIEIGYSVPFTADSSVPASISVDLCGAGDNGTMTLGFLETSEMAATYRVTEINYAVDQCETTIDGVITFGGGDVELDMAAILAAGSVDVTYEARIDGGAFTLDGGAQSKEDLITVIDEYDLDGVDGFDAVIDVQAAKSRTLFVDDDASDSTTQDTLSVTLSKTAADEFGATSEVVTITVAGDFSFADGSGNFSVNNGASVALNKDAGTLTITDPTSDLNGVGGVAIYDIQYTNGDGDVMSPGSYTVTAKVAYTEADVDDTLGSVSFGPVSGGEFTLNGSSTRFPSYLHGYSFVSNNIWVNNSGMQNGDVTIEGYDKSGNAFGPMVVTTSGAESITSIGGAIDKGLRVMGVAPGRIDLTVTINAPDNDIVIDAVANIAGDRVRYDDDTIRSRLDVQ
jgi:hypothetical protein